MSISNLEINMKIEDVKLKFKKPEIFNSTMKIKTQNSENIAADNVMSLSHDYSCSYRSRKWRVVLCRVIIVTVTSFLIKWTRN